MMSEPVSMLLRVIKACSGKLATKAPWFSGRLRGPQRSSQWFETTKR